MALSQRLKQGGQLSLRMNERQLAERRRFLERLIAGELRYEVAECICGGGADELIATHDRYGIPLPTVLCKRCGVMRSAERLDGPSTVDFYETHYRRLYDEKSGEELFAAQVSRGAGAVNLLRQLEAGGGGFERVFELGCGPGGYLLPIAEAGYDVAGCDYDETHLGVGRKRGLNLVQGSLDDLVEAKGGQADMLIALHVVEHFRDLVGELAALTRAVKPGGVFLVEVPSTEWLTTTYQGDLLFYLQNAHNWHLNRETLPFALQLAGWDVRWISDDGGQALAIRPDAPVPTPAAPRGAALHLFKQLVAAERQMLEKRAA